MDAVRMVTDIASVDPVSVNAATQLANLNGWDSLKMVRLVIGLEQAIGRELNEDELETLATVGDVASLLKS